MSNVFIAFFNVSLAACLLIAAVLLLRFALRRVAPKWVICLLWCAVALRLAVPFSIQSPLGLVPNAIPRLAETAQSAPDNGADQTDNTYVPGGQTGTALPGQTGTQPGNTDYTLPGETDTVSLPAAQVDPAAPATPSAPSNPVTPSVPAAETDPKEAQPAPALTETEAAPAAQPESEWGTYDVLCAAWLGGIASMFIYALASYIVLRRKLASSVPLEKGVKLCDSVGSPFVLGLFRPTVYLPFGLDAVTQDLVLRHERAHIARRDHWIKPLCFAVLALHWFNPLVWVAYILLCGDIEYACDERVCRDMSEKDCKAYTGSLLALGVRSRRIAACPVAFGTNNLKNRVKRVFSFKKPAVWVTVLILVASAVLVACFSAEHGESSAPDTSDVSDVSDVSEPDGSSEVSDEDSSEDSEPVEPYSTKPFITGKEITPIFVNMPRGSAGSNAFTLAGAICDGVYVTPEELGFHENVLSCPYDQSTEYLVPQKSYDGLTGKYYINSGFISVGDEIYIYGKDERTEAKVKSTYVYFELNSIPYFEITVDQSLNSDEVYIVCTKFGLDLTVYEKGTDSQYVNMKPGGYLLATVGVSAEPPAGSGYNPGEGYGNYWVKTNSSQVEQLVLYGAVGSASILCCGDFDRDGNNELVTAYKGVGQSIDIWQADGGELIRAGSPAGSDEYFNYYPKPGDSYAIKAKDGVELPQNLVIPAEYDGKPVTELCTGAFNMHRELISVTVPESVTRIGNSAFYACDKLENAAIPNGVTEIGDSAFQGCKSLVSLELPESVTGIRKEAFYGCESVKRINIPASVASIGLNAFGNCSGLESITVAPGNPVYSASGNCLIETASKTLISGCKNSVIPNDGSVTAIGGGAFGSTGFESISIPEGITEIGAGAFARCENLRSITIPESVTIIGSSAFYGCTRLTSVTLPKGITEIALQMFYGCTSLKNVNIPEGVAKIGPYAFTNCSSLAGINIPASAAELGDSPFFGCVNLESITVAPGNTVYSASGNCLIETASKTLLLGCKNSVIPNDGSVTAIGGNAFVGCEGIKSITVPESVNVIGGYSFGACRSLTEITVLNRDAQIYPTAFKDCAKLKSFAFPDGATKIDKAVFLECAELESVTIPAGVKLIDENAFGNCAKLKDVCFAGTEEQWNAITVATGNEALSKANVFYKVDRQGIESGKVYQASADKSLKYGAVQGSPQTEIFTSRAALDAYLQSDELSACLRYVGTKEYTEACADFDEAFFRDNFLVVAFFEEPSGGNTVTLTGGSIGGDGVFTLYVERNTGGMTDDMGYWFIFAGFPKTMLPQNGVVIAERLTSLLNDNSDYDLSANKVSLIQDSNPYKDPFYNSHDPYQNGNAQFGVTNNHSNDPSVSSNGAGGYTTTPIVNYPKP